MPIGVGHSLRKTKIICTLGPSTRSEEKIKALMLGGMDVARFNFSHLSSPERKLMFKLVRKLSDELQINVATMLDTCGPEIRLGRFAGSKAIVNSGSHLVLPLAK